MKKNMKLDNYFYQTKYALFYFDIQIKKLEITKAALLKELDIPYMSYRRSKEGNTNIGKKIIQKLEHYFKMNALCLDKKEEYENTLNQILTRFYYRGENLKEFEPILEAYLKENNYLKPIFQLFALLIRMQSNKSIESIAQEEYLCFEELLSYKKKYFISPFVELLVMLEISFSGDKLIEFDKDIYFSEEMKGLVYYSYNANAYLAKRYDLCLYYAQECKSYLIQDSNYKRIITLNLSYFACLNQIGEYHKCMKEAKAQLSYLYESYPSTDLVYFTEIHYYTACLGAKMYKEVIEDHIHRTEYNCYEYVFLILATYSFDKKLFKQITSKYNLEAKTSENFLNKYKVIIENLIGYLTTRKKTHYLEKLIQSELNIGVKDIILKFY